MSISANFNNTRPSLLLDFANSQQLDPRVTFSRSTTAPYYGNTRVLAEQNLQRYSQDFTNAGWQISNITVGTGITAPDGTTTANSLTITNATNYIQSINIPCNVSASTAYTASIYLAVSTGTASGNLVIADTPAYATTTQAVSLTTTWQRFTVIRTTSANATQAYIILNSFPNGAVIYAWGAQLEQRSSATAYNATTTSALTNYIPQLLTAPINAPRFDFNPTTGESLGLLIEQSSTNLLTYSQDFSNAVWTKTNATITTGANIAPDGTQTASKLIESTSTGGHNVSNLVTVISATNYTSSIYAKASERGYILMFDNNLGVGKYFNLFTGTILGNFGAGPASATITPVGNGWYRCTITNTTTSTNQTGVNVYISTDGSSISYTGNGYSGVYLWGAQLE